MKKAEAPSTTLHSNHQLVAQIVSEERRLRTWLRKKGVTGNQIDDIIQETYMRIMSRTSNDLVTAPLAYAKRTALSILQQQSRRLRIAAFEQLDCLEADRIPDPYPDPEQNVQWRTMLLDVLERLHAVPEKSRSIFILRRLEATPCREVADRFHISESYVEKITQKTHGILMASMRE